jgi:ribosomal protein L3
MMTYFTEAGLAVPATVISLESGNYVTAVKTPETDGYAAVQVRLQQPHAADPSLPGSAPGATLRNRQQRRVCTQRPPPAALGRPRIGTGAGGRGRAKRTQRRGWRPLAPTQPSAAERQRRRRRARKP